MAPSGREVCFFGIPVHATEPNPALGVTDVDVNVIFGWKAGRDAARHNVYLNADEQAGMMDRTFGNGVLELRAPRVDYSKITKG